MWEKSPPYLVERFGRLLERFPELERRQMFGFPAAFAASGHMVTGLHRVDWIVRLDATDQAALGRLGGRPFEPLAGRPMTGFLTLPEGVLGSDDAVAEWIGRAQRHVASMPPKKPRRKSAARA